MPRALIVGFFVALCAALLGVTLVLKRLSMIGDGLSHVGFGALAVALALNWAPLMVAMPVVMAAALLLLRLSENSSIKGDTAIALFSSSALAIGLLVVNRGHVNVNISSYLFGSILAINSADAVLSVVLAIGVLAVFMFFYHKIFAVVFDEEFVSATGLSAAFYKTVIGLMTAVTIVSGMRIMGTLLISSLVIFPGVSSMRVFGSFRGVTCGAMVISVINFFVGMIVSLTWNLQPGPSIVLVHTVVFAVIWLISGIKRHKG